MRLYDLPDGTTIDLNTIRSIGKLNVCKHDDEYTNYEVYFHNGDSFALMELDLPRATMLALWAGD